MVCNPGEPCYHSLEGKVITGRSTAGHDVRIPFNDYYSRQRAVPQNHAMGPPVAGERIAALPPQEKRLEIDWGLFFWGGVAGLVAGYFLFAGTGRRIAYKAAKKVGR